MKSIFYFLLITFAVFTSCKNNSTTQSTDTTTISVATADTATTGYICPMKCQKDTVYAAAGQCPVCKMDLEKVAQK